MPIYEHFHDTIHWYMNDLTSRIIAKSGIASDRYQLGKIILQSFEENPDLILQIDGATGESETNGSVLRRSIQCAKALKARGVQPGDVVVLMAPNHLDLCIPFYACLFIGASVAPVDRFLKVSELESTFTITEPKTIFCQSEKVAEVKEALDKVKLLSEIITFDTVENGNNFIDFLKEAKSENEEPFKATDIDPENTTAILISTSGTTGLPKVGCATHKNFVIMGPYYWAKTIQIPSFASTLVASPLQWLSAIITFVCAPYLKFTRVQSSLPSTQDHLYDLINKYRPSYVVISPTMLTTLLKPGDRDRCDFTCFEQIMVGGSSVPADLIALLKTLTAPDTEVINVYGMSELTSLCFSHSFSSPTTSCGKPIGILQYRIVDCETNKDVTSEPYARGELWMRGPGFFKGYYKNPEATKDVFSEDGWFKSGDIFYRDEHWNFYFVERIKLLLKYRNNQISPAEVESVIRQLPGVLDVAVMGLPHAEYGDLPVACVVRRRGAHVTAQEVKDIVKETLSDPKQLRGGVVFMTELPTTASTKVHRQKLKQMLPTLNIE